MLAERYLRGEMKLDEFISRRYKLDDINRVFKHMAEGEGFVEIKFIYHVFYFQHALRDEHG